MYKAIISGGPHTGKTTLLNELKKHHPHLHYVPEPATLVIEEERLREKDDLSYAGTFPWNNYPEFGPKVIKKSLDLEAMIPGNAGIVLLDRSLIDTVAYARLNNCEHLLPDLYAYIKSANYSKVFLCDFVGDYQSNNIRAESFQEAQALQNALALAYRESGLPIVKLPSASVNERMQIMKENVGI